MGVFPVPPVDRLPTLITNASTFFAGRIFRSYRKFLREMTARYNSERGKRRGKKSMVLITKEI